MTRQVITDPAVLLDQLRDRGVLHDDGSLCAGALLTRREVEAVTRRSRSSIYRDKEEGLFPQPIRTGRGSVHWRAGDIEQWKSSGAAVAE